MTSAAPSNTAPHSVTMRAPQRSLAEPHANEPNAITMKLIVIANEMPARDQPVSADIGARNTASENIAPTAMQPMSPPSATMTQRYGDSFMDQPFGRTGIQISTADCGLRGSNFSS